VNSGPGWTGVGVNISLRVSLWLEISQVLGSKVLAREVFCIEVTSIGHMTLKGLEIYDPDTLEISTLPSCSQGSGHVCIMENGLLDKEEIWLLYTQEIDLCKQVSDLCRSQGICL